MKKKITAGESMSLTEIEKRLEEINQQVGNLIALAAKENDIGAYQQQLKDLMDETTSLKAKRDHIQIQREKDHATAGRVEIVVTALDQVPTEIQWDESIIRQLVDTVKVVSKVEKIILKTISQTVDFLDGLWYNRYQRIYCFRQMGIVGDAYG